MKGKKPSLLRSALQEMKVNEPLRLPKGGPAFRSPHSEERKEAPQNEAPPKEVPSSELTQEELPQIETPQTQYAQIEESQSELSYFEPPQDQANQLDRTENRGTQSEVPQFEIDSEYLASEPSNPRDQRRHNERTQIEVPHDEVTKVRAALSKPTQNKMAGNERTKNGNTQIEPPPKENTRIEVPTFQRPRNEAQSVPRISNRFFRLSDRAFSTPQLRNLSGDCFRLFLWMSTEGWRYLNSDGSLRASIGYLELNTGMSHASISRCLRTLREESLIVLLETDYKFGNIWRVSPIALGGGSQPDGPTPGHKVPATEAPRNGIASTSIEGSSPLKSRQKQPQNEWNIINIKKEKKLSQQSTADLFARVERNRAIEKQRTEREALEALLQTHSADEILRAVLHVEQYGTQLGTACHSLFRYLASAIDDVLRSAHPLAAKDISIIHFRAGDDTEQSLRPNTDIENDALAAFRTLLSEEERKILISEYVATNYTFTHTPSPSVAHTLTALKWFRQREDRSICRSM